MSEATILVMTLASGVLGFVVGYLVRDHDHHHDGK